MSKGAAVECLALVGERKEAHVGACASVNGSCLAQVAKERKGRRALWNA